MLIIEKNIVKSGAQEPVTLSEASIYFRNEDSGDIEDNLILDLLSAARSYIEQRINRSLIARELEVIFFPDYVGFLPFGPVTGTVTFTNDATLKYGAKYPYLETTVETKATYETEAFNDPQINAAILELAFFYYTRGTFEWAALPVKVKRTIQEYSRNTII